MQPTWHTKIRDDIVQIFDPVLLSEFQNKTVTILGGSGFLGRWLLSYFLEAMQSGILNLELNVLTRNPAKISMLFPEFRNDLRVLNGDLSLANPILKLPRSDFFIHAATPTVPATGFNDGLKMVKGVVHGAELIIDSARCHSNSPRVIHLSSGIVYGQDLTSDKPIFEKIAAPRLAGTTDYETAKLLTEQLLVSATLQGLIRAANPRLFAFIGPGLSLTDYFAAGNFMNSVLNSNVISINGNASTARSYMYPTDLITWLLSVLVNPTVEPINVGGKTKVSLRELAELMNRLNPKCQIRVNEVYSPANFYYPSTELTEARYKVAQRVTLEDGLKKWLSFLKNS
jgi:nucleoside-diphosphate-sugar epimerase